GPARGRDPHPQSQVREFWNTRQSHDIGRGKLDRNTLDEPARGRVHQPQSQVQDIKNSKQFHKTGGSHSDKAWEQNNTNRKTPA
ncbi:MAG: hypothetical protein ACI9YL_001180, partial [Luteibaculaceae bacterium]